MIEQAFDPNRFFDRFPRFIESSKTGPTINRLNARYFALVHSNREQIRDSCVLDLASHDGRFSFAALQNGATRVIGIEHDETLVQSSHENMEFYEVPHERYEILLGDLFDRINDVKQCDVVFCFGILYHISDHMLLLSKIAELEPRVLIVDSAVSRLEDPVIEVRNPRVGDLPDASPIVEGWPSKSALDAMLWSLGWTAEYFDWAGSGLTESPELHDYRTGGRVTAVVKCNEVAPELRDRAVQVVLNRHAHTKWQKGLAIVEEAAKVGMTPQALRFWVGRAERQRSRPSE